MLPYLGQPAVIYFVWACYVSAIFVMRNGNSIEFAD